MKQTKIIMGMPVTIEIVDTSATPPILNQVFSYFRDVDQKFSTYKKNSEISLINQGKIPKSKFSPDMETIFRLSQETQTQTNGYFNILHQGKYDPSGIVKGWAIFNAAKLLKRAGLKNFYLDVGGDVQTSGKNHHGSKWRVGIRSPFNQNDIVKVLHISNEGVATSGTYIRGQHIYNPLRKNYPLQEIISLTVVGPNIYEADRFATAAFAMGEKGIEFIQNLNGFEGYMIDHLGKSTFTSGFDNYTHPL